MFYTKTRINEMEVKVNVSTDNVYCCCPMCGKEMQVDLVKIFRGSKDGTLENTQAVCEDCEKEVLRTKTDKEESERIKRKVLNLIKTGLYEE
jgi:hypothetical protein